MKKGDLVFCKNTKSVGIFIERWRNSSKEVVVFCGGEERVYFLYELETLNV